MKRMQCDVAVIGAGTAGLGAHRQATTCGADALLIEGRRFGTTCASVGCMPSKLLIAAAEAAHNATHLETFGLSLPQGALRIDGDAVMARVQRERDRFVGGVIRGMEARIPEERRLFGMARFTGPSTLAVEGVGTVEAERFVLAIGGRPWVPPALREGAGDRLLTTDDIFELPTLPTSILVVGAGVIGFELGQAFHRLGVRTTIAEMQPRIPFILCRHIQEEARAILEAELDLVLGMQDLRLEKRGDQVHGTITLADGSTREDHWDYVLAATGRRPDFASLDLPAAGVILDERGQPAIDPDTLQVQDLPIFVAGDATQHLPLLHEASDEGHIAGQNAAHWPDVRPGPRRTPLAIVFSDPQFASVGRTGCALDERLTAVGTVSFASQGRARVMAKNQGSARIYAELGTGRLLGAEIFAPHAEHMAHLLAWAIQSGLTVDAALEMPFYHPVLEEGLRTALRDLQAQLNRKGERTRMVFDCRPPAS